MQALWSVMASFFKDSARNGFRAQLYVRGVKRALWLGSITRKQAAEVCRHLEAINRARDTGTTIPPAEVLWLRVVSPRIVAQLATWGLIEHRAFTSADLPKTLGAYVKHYIDGRTDVEPNTRVRLNNSATHLVAQLGASTSLSAVTPGDAERAARALYGSLAKSTAGKIVKDARQFFKAAISDRLIAENPFANVAASSQHDTTREHYVTRDDVQRLIDAAPNGHWRLLLAMSRFGGLRVPSEPLLLEWSHVDVAGGRITITSRKTKKSKPTRVIPLFPEIAPHLAALYDSLPDGASKFVFTQHRSTAAKTWRKQLLTLMKSAGVQQWDKLWQNMRASCRTDLEAHFPGFVVDAWLGHSAEVGRKHYTRVNDEHYAAACGVARGVNQPSTPDNTRHNQAAK